MVSLESFPGGSGRKSTLPVQERGSVFKGRSSRMKQQLTLVFLPGKLMIKEPGELYSWGSRKRKGHDLVNKQQQHRAKKLLISSLKA